MFERIGPVTFEPVIQITVPGLTLLIAPLNLLIAAAVSGLIGLGVTVTVLGLAGRNSGGVSPVLSGLTTGVAGVSCLIPGATIVFRIPVPASFVPIFQLLIPASLVLLLVTLAVVLHRIGGDGTPTDSPEPGEGWP